MGKLPIILKPVVCHIEHLDRPRTQWMYSYEGWGLSVSEDPEAWREIIQRLEPDDPVWVLYRRDGHPGQFVDLTDPKSSHRTHLSRIAIEKGLLKPTLRYVGWVYDDENFTYLSQDFSSKQEMCSWLKEELRAVEEVGAPKNREDVLQLPYVEIVHDYEPTTAFRKQWKELTGSNSADRDMTLLFLLERTNRFDGAWWNDAYRPYLTAPRGVVFQNKLHEWAWAEGSCPSIGRLG